MKMAKLDQLRSRIIEVLSAEDDPALLPNEHHLASAIDSLQLLEIIEIIEQWIDGSIPQAELTEDNFNSIDALLNMAIRLSKPEI
jgi:acyl carrier protein